MPADATFAQSEVMLQDAVAFYESIYQFGNSASPNLIAKENTAAANRKGEFGETFWDNLRIGRDNVATSIDTWQEAIDEIILSFSKVLKFAGDDADVLWPFILRHYVDNSLSVNSREFTFGTPAAGGGNVGNGLIHLLTVDKYGNDLEHCFAEDYVAEIVEDEFSGTNPHEESWRFKGEPLELDQLFVDGSGLESIINSLSARATLLLNPSFEEFTGSLAVPTDIANWIPSTPGAFGNFEISESIFYRDFLGITTPRSVQFKDNDSLEQKFTVKNTEFDADIPIYVQIALFRESSCDGDVILTLGGSTVTIDIATLNNAAWNVVKLPLNKELWYDNFNVADGAVKIELSGRTTGTIFVDDVIVNQFQAFANYWIAPVGGQTKWRRQPVPDVFTYTFSTAVDALIQLWLRRRGIYLPGNKAGTETLADPVL